MPEAALSARAVSHTYGEGAAAARALESVTAGFEPGLLHLVMGPSGSGKTTLLSVLGGILTPGAGAVRLLGEEISALPETERAALRRRHVGFIFQSFRLFRALSAIENVMVALELAGRKGAAAKAAATGQLESLGLAGKGHRQPHELSGGEKQRVAIARAVVNEPEVLLADEPTASLDGASGLEIIGLLRDLAVKRGRLVIAVSHDPRLAAHAHRTLRLEDGRIVEDWRAAS